MSNIKLTNANGAQIIYNDVDTIKIPLADGSGDTDFIEGGGILPVLHAPSIKLQDNSASVIEMTNPITNGDFAENFIIYNNEEELATQDISENTYDLSTVLTEVSTNSITCAVSGSNFKTSDKSSESINYSLFNMSYDLDEYCSLNKTPSVIANTDTYSAEISFTKRYKLDTCTILMGGIDITESSLSGNFITIKNPTDAISIKVTSQVVVVESPIVTRVGDFLVVSSNDTSAINYYVESNSSTGEKINSKSVDKSVNL